MCHWKRNIPHEWAYLLQPSQNVSAADHNLAAYNEISAAYFTLVRLVFRTRLPLLPITIASLPTTQKHFDWAAVTLFMVFSLSLLIMWSPTSVTFQLKN